MKKVLLLLVLICGTFGSAFSQSLSTEEEIEILRSRLYENYFASTSPASEAVYGTQLSDGSWADIDYDSKALAYWPALTHLQRLKSMAHSYAEQEDKNSEFAKMMADGVNRGLVFWEQKKPTSNNWWYQDIGKQKEFIYILILMGDAIPEDMQNAICKYLVVTEGNQSGANLTDMATGLLVRGVVQENAGYITDAVSKIASVGKIQNRGKDGVQIDNSYLFHNQLVFSINYNIVTLSCLAMWSNMLRGLSFQLPESSIEVVRNVMLDGNRWMFRNDRVDWATAGRFITIPSALNVSTYLTTTNYLLSGDAENADRYEDFLAVLKQEKPDTITGNKYFFRAEYMVNRRPEFFYSVKMSSTRVSGTEMGNGQNLKGYWLGMGANCLMRDANEYDSIYPLWDWTKVPGTTAADELPTCGFGMKGGSNFSGGLSNGIDGIASMQINQRGVNAKKSWFVFENEVVCLGNGISSVTNINKVFSTIEQRRKQGPVLVDGKDVGLVSQYGLENPKSVYHDSTLYVFPKSQKLYLSAEERTNNWYSISNIESKELVTDTVFSLWYDHGRMPSNASYCYVTVPFIRPEEVDDYIQNLPIQIVQATHNAHVVTHTGKKLTGIVFFSQGTVTVDSMLDVQASRPCIIMIDQSCEPMKVTVSDPLQSTAKLVLTLKHKKFEDETFTVDLPTGNYIGNSVSFFSELDRDEATGLENVDMNQIKIEGGDRCITVSGAVPGNSIRIYDASGNALFNGKAGNSVFCYSVPNPGVYLVSVNDCTKKISVN